MSVVFGIQVGNPKVLNKLEQWLIHWLNNSLRKPDDHFIKCATCGWEGQHLNSLIWIYIGGNNMEGICPSCRQGTMYYKKDCGDLSAKPIPLIFNVIFKGDEHKL